MAKQTKIRRLEGKQSAEIKGHAAAREGEGLMVGGAINASSLDAFAFAQQQQRASGSVPIQQFSRLLDGMPAQPGGEAGLVRWQVRGDVAQSGRYRGEALLHLDVQARPVLICQRCNTPFVYVLDVHLVWQLVRSEADLETEDLPGQLLPEAGSMQAPEKVVGSGHFDLLSHIEDELILSVPYVPVHGVCPVGSYQTAPPKEGVDTRSPSPFAVLEQLKQKH